MLPDSPRSVLSSSSPSVSASVISSEISTCCISSELSGLADCTSSWFGFSCISSLISPDAASCSAANTGNSTLEKSIAHASNMLNALFIILLPVVLIILLLMNIFQLCGWNIFIVILLLIVPPPRYNFVNIRSITSQSCFSHNNYS